MNASLIKRRTRASLLALALLPLAIPGPTRAQAPERSVSASSAAAHPDLDGWREAGLSLLGTGFLVSGQMIDVAPRDVPTEGYDPVAIGLSLDRGAVGEGNASASATSDWTRNAALAFPLAIGLATSPGGKRASGLARTSVVHAETLLISQGLTLLGKKLWGRARPYTYVPESTRPDGASYDVTQSRTFLSMPSGHASAAWSGTALGLTEYMLNRPEAPWWERASVGFVGGALAGATSALRVEAGQHFPSDVVAGAGIGVVAGVTVPLLHRGGRRVPSAKSWLEMAGGLVVGTFLGTLAAEKF